MRMTAVETTRSNKEELVLLKWCFICLKDKLIEKRRFSTTIKASARSGQSGTTRVND
jgi:hypothetical protein